MSEQPVYSSVLVPTDLSDRAALALPHAAALVAPGGTIHLAHVIEQPEVPNPGYAHYGPTAGTPEEQERRERKARAALEELSARFSPSTRFTVRCHVEHSQGDRVDEHLCRLAGSLRVDLVCLASHGRRGLARVLLGSVAEGVLRRCRLPTLVVRAPLGSLRSE